MMTGRDAERALRSTNRVCGSGPSDEQDDAVDHGQAALDLTTEVGVARSVDHVDDGDGAVFVVAVNRGVLREDGDALFALQVTGVHHAVDQLGALGEGAGLAQHRVDEGGLAMVDVRDDGDVAEIGGAHAGRSPGC
jgi:hypothetical protein